MKSLEQQLASAWPPTRWRDVTVLVAVSGGADSVALLRALAALSAPAAGRLAVAHFNHALRGDASDADAEFVADLAGRLELPCHIGRHADGDRGIRTEESARAARYEFLSATAARVGARYVTTAHTADDQAETILHNVLRGTGLAGLAGMPRARELLPGISLVRPLLTVRRSEILAYLAELGQSFRDDHSNRDLGYTRNRLRHELIPRLADDYNPRVVEALLRLGNLASEAHVLLEAEAVELAERAIVDASPTRILIDTAVLAAAPRYLVREILHAAWSGQGWPLQAMGHAEWDALVSLAVLAFDSRTAEPRPAKRIFPGEIAVERIGDRLVLEMMRDERGNDDR